MHGLQPTAVRTGTTRSSLCDHPHEGPVCNGTKLQIGLMITARAGACILRGNKTGDSRLNLANTLCILCNLREPETEDHLLLNCTRYDAWRGPLMMGLNSLWTEQQQALYQIASDCQKRLYLLGAKMGYNDTNMRKRFQRDLLVKTYLQAVNTHRVQGLGLPDLRDAFDTTTDFSIEEAVQYEAELRAELELDEVSQDAHQVTPTPPHTTTHTGWTL